MSIQRVPLRGIAETQLVRHAESINGIIDGRIDVADTVTLTANVATTVVTDNKFESQMVPSFTPTTANAATGLTSLYVSARTQGAFTLTHANNAQTDRTYLYTRFG